VGNLVIRKERCPSDPLIHELVLSVSPVRRRAAIIVFRVQAKYLERFEERWQVFGPFDVLFGSSDLPFLGLFQKRIRVVAVECRYIA
jgi:hypothetical protein